jgi:hypothetical protein
MLCIGPSRCGQLPCLLIGHGFVTAVHMLVHIGTSTLWAQGLTRLEHALQHDDNHGQAHPATIQPRNTNKS